MMLFVNTASSAVLSLNNMPSWWRNDSVRRRIVITNNVKTDVLKLKYNSKHKCIFTNDQFKFLAKQRVEFRGTNLTNCVVTGLNITDDTRWWNFYNSNLDEVRFRNNSNLQRIGLYGSRSSNLYFEGNLKIGAIGIGNPGVDIKGNPLPNNNLIKNLYITGGKSFNTTLGTAIGDVTLGGEVIRPLIYHNQRLDLPTEGLRITKTNLNKLVLNKFDSYGAFTYDSSVKVMEVSNSTLSGYTNTYTKPTTLTSRVPFNLGGLDIKSGKWTNVYTGNLNLKYYLPGNFNGFERGVCVVWSNVYNLVWNNVRKKYEKDILDLEHNFGNFNCK